MTAIIMSSITALISAGIGVAIWALQKKIDRMEKDADKRNAQQPSGICFLRRQRSPR